MENQISEKQISGHSTASFVLGCVAAVMALLTFPSALLLIIFAVLIGLPTTIVGVVQGCKGFDIDGSARATTGIILNIFFLASILIMSPYNKIGLSGGVVFILLSIVAMIIALVVISDTKKRKKMIKTERLNSEIVHSKNSTASLVLGLCGIAAGLLSVIGFAVTIVGLVQGCKGFRKDFSARATAGKTLNIIFIGASVLSTIFWIALSTN